MKKIISIMLAVMLVSALAVTSFAAPTIDYTFSTSDGKAYVFGTVDSEITDMGLKITNKRNTKEYAEFSVINSSEIADVNNSGKFGFGIDPNGQLEDKFTVKPYYKTTDATVEGASYAVTPSTGTVKTVAEGSMLAVADAYISGKDGKCGVDGVAPAPAEGEDTAKVGSQFMIQDNSGTSNTNGTKYFGSGVFRYDISDIDMDASDILLQITARSAGDGMLKIVSNPIRMTVRKVEDATQNWEDTTAGFSGYSTITGGAQTNAKYVTDIYNNDETIIAEITDCEIKGSVSGFNGATTSTGLVYFTADITEYVKAEKAKGNDSITIALKGDRLGSTLWTYQRTYTGTYKTSKVVLTWK